MIEELTDKEKNFLRKVFHAADVIFEDLKISGEDWAIDFSENDLFALAEKLGVDYWLIYFRYFEMRDNLKKIFGASMFQHKTFSFF